MKLHHFTLSFIIIAVAIIVLTDIRTNNLKAVIRNKEQMDLKLDIAVDDGVAKLAQVDNNNNVTINKDNAVNSFFLSLYSSFGVLNDKEICEKLNLYIPVIVVTMEEGYYILYSYEYTASDGFTYVARRWSEQYLYYYEDEDFVYGFTLGDVVTIYDKNNLLGGGEEQDSYIMDYHDFQSEEAFSTYRAVRADNMMLDDEAFDLIRKETIVRCIEDTMAFYASRHNKIASQYGITYQFSLPTMNKEEWAPFIDDPSMFVVFQGYPYGDASGETMNRVVSAGAKLTKDRLYYIEQRGWYLLYHKSSCPELSHKDIILWEERYYDPLSCIQKGCYPCPGCIKNGISVPDYSP